MEANLDQLRAEVEQEDKVVVIGGTSFAFPFEIPADVFDMLNEGRAGAALREMFGERYDEAKKAAGGALSAQDFARIVNTLYGLEIPESLASDDSSPSTGAKQKRTSNGSTASTSGKSSGGKPRRVGAA